MVSQTEIVGGGKGKAMTETMKKAALRLMPKAKLPVLRAQLAFSRSRASTPLKCDKPFHEWLIPLLEAEIKKREGRPSHD